MRVGWRTSLAYVIFGMLITAFVSPIVPASASSAPTLEAPIIVDKTLKPGSTFSINVTVADVQRLFGFQFILSYDTSVLSAIDYRFHSPFTSPSPSEINDTAGYVAIAASSYMGDSNGLATLEPLPIVTIDFMVDARGSSLLDIHDSILADVYGEWIAHNVMDGFFANIKINVPERTATSATRPQPSNGQSPEPGGGYEPSGNRSILYIAPFVHPPDRLYASLNLLDTYSSNGIAANIEVFYNDIHSTSTGDLVASSIGIARYRPSGGGEWIEESIEVGLRQDSTGLFLFGATLTRYGWTQVKYADATPGDTHSLKIKSYIDLVWDAFIDDHFVTTITFSQDVTAEKYAVAQAESSLQPPQNPLREHLWNLVYYDSNWNPHNWQRLDIAQDEPYYARLTSTYEFHSTLQGDVSLDYMVDVVDWSTVSAHWTGPPRGQLGYSLGVDIDHDGGVNIIDLAKVSAHWNQGW